MSVGARSTSRPHPCRSITLWAEMMTRSPDESMNCSPATSSTSDEVLVGHTGSVVDRGPQDGGGMGIELADEHEDDLIALRCESSTRSVVLPEFRHGSDGNEFSIRDRSDPRPRRRRRLARWLPRRPRPTPAEHRGCRSAAASSSAVGARSASLCPACASSLSASTVSSVTRPVASSLVWGVSSLMVDPLSCRMRGRALLGCVLTRTAPA